MTVVDVQVHLWQDDRPDRPWSPAHRPHAGTPFGYPDLIADMDDAGVDKAVVIPPMLLYYSNHYALEASREHPDRLAVVGRFDPESSGAAERLARWRSTPGLLGIRMILNYENGARWMRTGALDWFWPAAERAGVPLMLRISHSFGYVSGIAERHPALTLIVDHMGVEPTRRFEVIDELVELAERPNVAVKLTGLPSYSELPYPFPDLVPHVRRVYEAFGPDRLLWGSDISQVRNRTGGRVSYAECVEMFRVSGIFTPADQEKLFGGNALRLLRW